jgi:hypothetical protein
VKIDIEKRGKQVVMICFVVLPQYFPGGTEETHKETLFKIAGLQAKV